MSEFDFDVAEFNDPIPLVPTHFHHLPWVNDMLRCTGCPIHLERQRVVLANGPLDATFMVLGRNPGRDEDRDGLPFIGKGGVELDTWLQILGLERTKIYVTNSCKCHTTKPRPDRPPKQTEIQVCTDLWLKREIEALPNLRVILGLGNDVVQFVLGEDAASTGQLVFYSVQIKLGDRLFDFIPLAHPGYLIRARQHLARMHDDVLPKLRDFLKANHPVSYARAKIA